MASEMTISDFMLKMQKNVPNNMFTEFDVYAEVTPQYMIEFGDASPVELAFAYGAKKEEISPKAETKVRYDGYGEFNEFIDDREADNDLAFNWLSYQYSNNKLLSYWPVTNMMIDDKTVALEPNGMMDQSILTYEGMTLHEFMKGLTTIAEQTNGDSYQIALRNSYKLITYQDAKVDEASRKVILTFKGRKDS